MNIRFSPPVGGISAKIGSLFNSKGDNTDDRTVDIDEDGRQLFREDIISMVKERLENSRNERLPYEKQWTLNSNFLMGNQFCDINLATGMIEQIEPTYDWLEREAYNQIAPIIETRIANLKKINYRMKVNPKTDELDDYSKAEISSKILHYLQMESDFETKKNTMIAWNELCGNCFFLSWWDVSKGEKYAVEHEIYMDNDGIEKKKEKAYYTGDVDYGIISPYEVFPESVYKQTIEAQRYIIIEQVKTVDDIYDLYGVEVKGGKVETFQLTPLPSGGGYGHVNTLMTMGHRTVENAAKLITYFERPSRKRPDGRMIIAAGDDKLIYYGKLPYKRIPLVQCICREVAGQFFGRSVIEDLIPRQRAYNGCVNRIHEYIKRVSIQGYFVEEGSVDMDEFAENGIAPGEALEYARGQAPPTPIQNNNLPSEIMNERYQLVRDMEYVAGVSQLTTAGSAPSGVTSGVAIEAIKATDDTRLSLTGDYVRNSIRNLARIWLEIYRQYANVRRAVRISGGNSLPDCIVWSSEDITSYDIEYTTENELLYTEDMQKQRFMELFNMGMFADENGRIPENIKQTAIESAKLRSYDNILSVNTLQIQAAKRENVFFERGAVPELSDLDNDSIHYEEHMKYALQMDFQILKQKKPEWAAVMEQHINAHKERTQQNNMQQMMQMMGQNGN